MKKLLCIILCIGMLMTFAACGEKEEEFDPYRELRNVKVPYDLLVYCESNFANVRQAHAGTITIDEYDGIYTCKGKVTITDDYGDKYVGNFEFIYFLEEGTERFHIARKYVETPRLQN